MSKNQLLLFITTITISFASEPSAFSAGDLSSRNPYGLTESEKHIFENKESIRDLKSKIISLEAMIEELHNSLEGLKSLNRGENENLSALKKDFFRLESDLKIHGEYQKKIDEDIKNNLISINELSTRQDEINKKSSEDGENIKIAVKELSGLIDNINSTYVHKDDLKNALDKLIAQIEEDRTPRKNKNETKENRPEDIFSKAKADFKKRKFKSALKDLEYLAKETEYNKAEVMFLMAEIYYQRGLYKEAITAFKNSAKMDDKAPYLDVLLFHTAISFDKIGNKGEAKRFYETLMSMFPKSYLFDSAKKRADKLGN